MNIIVSKIHNLVVSQSQLLLQHHMMPQKISSEITFNIQACEPIELSLCISLFSFSNNSHCPHPKGKTC